MKQDIWQKLPRPFFALAPMEAVTDMVFRHVILHAARPDIFFTEFVNASSFCSPKGIASTCGRLTFSNDEQPIIAQIWGSKPAEFAQMSIELAKMGFAGIDINMGCPDKAVLKTGSGSALIKTPELAAELIASAKTGGLPVSVKTRLGDTRIEQWPDWIAHLLHQDLANLTVHLRTRKEMSKVPAHYELISDIKEMRDAIAPQTLLTINGDIRDRQHGLEFVDKYGVDGIMIGRGIFTNPFAFEHNYREHSREELIELLNLHLNLHEKYSEITNTPTQAHYQALTPPAGYKNCQRKFDPLKTFFKIYIRDFPGASELRAQMMQARSINQVRQILFEHHPPRNNTSQGSSLNRGDKYSIL